MIYIVSLSYFNAIQSSNDRGSHEDPQLRKTSLNTKRSRGVWSMLKSDDSFSERYYCTLIDLQVVGTLPYLLLYVAQSLSLFCVTKAKGL